MHVNIPGYNSLVKGRWICMGLVCGSAHQMGFFAQMVEHWHTNQSSEESTFLSNLFTSLLSTPSARMVWLP